MIQEKIIITRHHTEDDVNTGYTQLQTEGKLSLMDIAEMITAAVITLSKAESKVHVEEFFERCIGLYKSLPKEWVENQQIFDGDKAEEYKEKFETKEETKKKMFKDIVNAIKGEEK